MSSSEHRENTYSSSADKSVGLSNDARPTSTTGGSDFHPDPPSETVAPTEVDTPPQQAATQPDSGGVRHILVQQSVKKPPFNQQVVGYAKEIRGTLLHNPETKEYGEKIVKGEAVWPPADKKSSSSTDSTQ